MKNVFAELHKVGQLLTLGIQIAATMLVPVLIGIYLDRTYDWTPWGVLIGMVVGFGGFFSLIWKLFIYKPGNDNSQKPE